MGIILGIFCFAMACFIGCYLGLEISSSMFIADLLKENKWKRINKILEYGQFITLIIAVIIVVIVIIALGILAITYLH